VTNVEILAPAGDFNTAIHGINAGANAVYVGLKDFSARKTATNLSLEELRCLKRYAQENNVRVYVAINTILFNEEIKNLIPIIAKLELMDIDGIIVQDLGFANLLLNNFKIPVHASTQLAAHNIHGVKFLSHMGFSRVVLSRELNLAEIGKIRKECPNIELEVFIHGAMCYGFSGLCLASGIRLNRSGNRGECGQICRSWMQYGTDKGYFFSLKDLLAGKISLNLKKLE
jgi:U32 family peptidase